jgi:glyoxylase-like metal-dependent hydrolase (beta-lactamase superfamily II)
MKVISLVTNPAIYSSNAYLVLGSWNCLDDMNTLVDTGTDPSILEQIESINTGVGKKPIEQILLTHSHFDHKGMLQKLIERYAPAVYAFAPIDGVSGTLKDKQILHMGDRSFEVIHTPGHSHDSICLYCAEERVLFSGDTPLRIRNPGGTYIEGYFEALTRISMLRIDTTYSGHDTPITENTSQIIRETIANVRRSEILRGDGTGGV